MAYQILGVALIAVLFFIVRFLDRTSAPKIKNLPEVPGVPIFGNLLQLGNENA